MALAHGCSGTGQPVRKPNPCYCSFCGLSDREVEWLLAGWLDVFICDQCVGVASERIGKLRTEKREIEEAVAALKHDVARCESCKPEPIHG
ncbi:MAG: ClpX C4-type zinc finger protein [Pseudolabrys sp.]